MKGFPMNHDQFAVAAVKGVIFDLSADEQAKVLAAAEAIRKVVSENGVHGAVALTLVTAELVAAAT